MATGVQDELVVDWVVSHALHRVGLVAVDHDREVGSSQVPDLEVVVEGAGEDGVLSVGVELQRGDDFFVGLVEQRGRLVCRGAFVDDRDAVVVAECELLS